MTKTQSTKTLDDWLLQLVNKLERQGKFASARNYRKTKDSFQHYREGKPLLMSDMTPEVIRAYNDWLYANGASRNTVSFYNRILRAACNKDQEDSGNKLYPNPFNNVYTGVDRTRKRSLDKSDILRIISLELETGQEMDYARDLFLFSFYARGMCFVDLAFLRDSDVMAGQLIYERSKTGQTICVRLEPCMQKIIDKWHPAALRGRIFPIVSASGGEQAFREYTYKMNRVNLMLKEIGKRINLTSPLNFYAARHTWATMARDLSIPIPVISSSLGHTSERTTRIYLDNLNQNILDKANRLVLDSLSSSSTERPDTFDHLLRQIPKPHLE